VRKSVLGTATDVVMDMVKKAASALVNNGMTYNTLNAKSYYVMNDLMFLDD